MTTSRLTRPSSQPAARWDRATGLVAHPVVVSRSSRAAALALASCVLALAAVPGPASSQAAASRAACRSGQVSLTFDDGPAGGVTPRLVRILRARQVPATFFMVGSRVAAAPSVARLVERGGFLIANHGYDHADMTGLSEAQVVSTIRRTDRQLRREGVHPINLVRPPYGAVDSDVYAAARRTHHTVVLWDVDPYDWDGKTANQIATSVLGQLKPHGRNIVLMHDGVTNSPRSVDAVPRIVRTARQRGYCFVALDEQGRPGYPTPTARISVEPEQRRVREGGTVRATLSLSAPAGRDTSVRLSVDSDTGSVSKDLDLRTRVVRVPAGTIIVPVTVPVVRDRLDEPTERFELGLRRGVGVRPRAGTVTVVVKDRDRPPRVSGEPVTVAEPAVGSASVPVVFRLSRPSGRDVTLTVTTVAQTADESDYDALTTTVSIPAGSRTVVVPVTVRADLDLEPVETFLLHLTRAAHARGSGGDAVVTVTPAQER
jgi:peptidoglycan/xylan/chitin deacetylase (PgdA/CDA1 family)